MNILRKGNGTLLIGMAQDKHRMESLVSFSSRESAVDYLCSFLTDQDNACILRKVLQEASPWQFDLPSLSDHQVDKGRTILVANSSPSLG